GLSKEAIATLIRIGGEGSYRLVSTLREEGQRTEEETYPSEQQIAALEELERRGLVSFSTPLSEYNKAISPFLTGKRSATGGGRIIGKLPKEAEHLLAESYELTNLGQRAVQLIVSVVSRDLARSPASAVSAQRE